MNKSIYYICFKTCQHYKHCRQRKTMKTAMECRKFKTEYNKRKEEFKQEKLDLLLRKKDEVDYDKIDWESYSDDMDKKEAHKNESEFCLVEERGY